MNVPLLDPRRANNEIATELRAAFDSVLDSGKFILGDAVTKFEAACADYLGVKHAIGVSSGTDALLVSLMALEIKPGDEVICPTFTFFATAGSVWRSGAKPVFVDSLPGSFNCDPEQVAQKVTAKTRAIMPVHLFGQCAEMDAIRAAAGDIPIIEDAAQAIGAEYQGKRAGGLGNLGCFSFFPSKNVGGFGDAGLVTANDDALADRVRKLRVHGGHKMYDHSEVGGNFRIDAMQAALLHVKLARVDAYAEARAANAARYDELLGNVKGVTLPTCEQSNHVYNQYVIRVHDGRRDALMAHLKENGIGCAIYYPKPLHLQPCFADLGHEAGDFPVAEKLSEEVLALPIFSELTSDELEYVVEKITG